MLPELQRSETPTPDHMRDLIQLCREHKVSIYESEEVQLAVDVLLKEFFQRKGQFRERTFLRLESGLKAFRQFCEQHGLSYLPAKFSSVELFVQHRASTVRTSTLKADIWAVSTFHRKLGLPDPTLHEYVRATVKEATLTKIGDLELIKQATPLNLQILKELQEVWTGTNASLIQKRDYAALAMSYNGLLRCSELRHLRLDMTTHINGRLRIAIPFSKTNISGIADYVTLSHSVSRAVLEYMRAANLSLGDSGYLIQGISAHNKVKRMKDSDGNLKPVGYTAVKDIYTRAWKVTKNYYEPNSRAFSTHSCRVGAAVGLAQRKVDVLQIMKAGRWTNATMPNRYIKTLDNSDTTEDMMM